LNLLCFPQCLFINLNVVIFFHYSSIDDLIGVCEPHIVAVVSDELSEHGQDLDLPDLLQVVRDLVALDFGVALELTLHEQLELVDLFKMSVVYMHGFAYLILGVFFEWRFELNGDIVRLGLSVRQHTRLQIVDHFRHRRIRVAKLVV